MVRSIYDSICRATVEGLWIIQMTTLYSQTKNIKYLVTRPYYTRQLNIICGSMVVYHLVDSFLKQWTLLPCTLYGDLRRKLDFG